MVLAYEPAARPPPRTSPVNRSSIVPVLALVAGLAGSPAAAGADEATFELDGMTYVGSKAEEQLVVVEAIRAHFHPGNQTATLEQVHAHVTARDEEPGFEMTCDRGELNMATNAFFASGSVEGRTGDGRHFSTSWVRYDHKKGMAFTDAPVTITDTNGTYRGGGFRYDVKDQRFRLLGGASVVREQ